MTAFTTRSASNYRDGCYASESLTLTSSSVQANGVRVVGAYQLDDPRGTEGQVLIVPKVTIRSGATRDLAFIGDMSGNIYAFNAHPPFNLIWKHPIADPMSVTKTQDMWGINPRWSILSTGVVDMYAGIWYLVALTTPDGSAAKATYWFHSIDIRDGSAAHPPIPLDGSTYVGPSGAKKVLGSALRKQRAALTLVGKTVYVPFGSFAETAATNLGWVVAIDVTNTPRIVNTWCTGDKHIGAGIWQAGAGLSVGDDGTLHGMTGNGGFDPPGDLGECFFKLAPSLSVKQWWSPYSDAGRKGLDPTLPTDLGTMEQMAVGTPNNAMAGMMDMAGVDMPGMEMAAAAPSNVHKVGDQDLGSGGPLYLPRSLTGYAKNIIMGGGKDGIMWILDADNMGNTHPADFAPDKIARNYAHLLYPPWGWTFNGMGINLAPANLDELPIAVGGYTRHIHGQPVAYVSPDHGLMTFVQGENGPVRAASIDKDGAPHYLACGTKIASQGMPPPGGMPGGMLSLAVTAQKANTAVLWSCMPWYGDANKTVTPGRLVAYGANWVNQQKNLIKLWDSEQWGINWAHNKFCPPTPQANYLFVPTYDGRVLVFG